jgi:Restriction endonuclease
MNEFEGVVARPTAHYPPADITPAEFEIFVTSLFDAIDEGGAPTNLRIQNHEMVRGADGTYDFDATVRYELAGMAFLVIVEAKLHKNPIKRETVQVLYQKFQSVGAQKAVLVSTAPFQRGALDFALAHGIALVTVTEGRFTFETKAAATPRALTRQEAQRRYGIPTFVGHVYSRGESVGSIGVTLMSPEHPEYLRQHLLAHTRGRDD